MQCDLCDYKQIVLSYCDHRESAVKTQGGDGQGDRPQKEPVLGYGCSLSPVCSMELSKWLHWLRQARVSNPQVWGQWMLAFPALKRRTGTRNSPHSVSRDGGACLGTAGVTQSLEGGLNRNSKPQSPAGSLPSALNHP